MKFPEETFVVEAEGVGSPDYTEETYPVELPIVLHASGAETEDGAGDDVDVRNYRIAEYCLDVTVVEGTPAGVHILLQGKDQTSGKYKTMDEQVITTTGTFWLTITCLAFRYLRVSWNTFDGVDDSVTFSAALEAKS